MITIKLRNGYMRKAYGYARAGNVTMAQACYDMAKRACKVTVRQEGVLTAMLPAIVTGRGFNPHYGGLKLY